MKFVIADDEPNALEDILCTLKETLDEDAEFYTAKHAYEALELIKNRSWLLLLIAVIVSISSYAASLFVAERKRGVV